MFSESIEAKRNALAAQVISLLRQMNDLTYPARLPSELLSLVFSHIQLRREGEFHWDGCLTAAHVCHSWREVALRTPQLWTSVDISRGEQYIRMMLERSSKCLLDITDMSTNYRRPRFALLWPQLPRTRSIILSRPPISKHLPAETIPAPYLQSFIEDYEHPCETPLLPLLDAPRLHGAVLLSPGVPSLHSHTSLEHLTLRWEYTQNGVPSLHSIMSTIGSLPALSHLSVDIQLDYWEENLPIPQNCPVASLNRLQTLAFAKYCSIVGAAFVLEHTKLPPSARILAQIKDDAPSHVPRIRRLLRDNVMTVILQWQSREPLFEMCLYLEDTRSVGRDITITISAPVGCPAEQWWDEEVQTRAEHPLTLKFPYSSHILPLLLPFTSDLCFLTIGVHWLESDIERVHELLEYLKAIENVALYNPQSSRNHESGLRFLEVDEVFTGLDGRHLTPSLSTLKLARINFRDGHFCNYCNPILYHKGCECEAHRPRLITWLAKRRDDGLAIGRLVLDNCPGTGISEDGMVELKQLVKEVVVLNEASERYARDVAVLRERFSKS